MNSKERLLGVWRGDAVDYIPLTTWCFGLRAPEHLRWQQGGSARTFWYSLRMEHIHTLPQPWDLEDDFRRVLAWQSLGVDDVLDVSVPWSIHPAVTWEDRRLEPGARAAEPVLVRSYQTPSGPLEHAVRRTGEDPGPGWVVQPEVVPLFEDYSIPRAVKHAVASPADIAPVLHLYAPPDENARAWFAGRIARVNQFATTHGVAVQAWSAFGMDAVIWLTGVEGAIMMAMDHPTVFGELVDAVLRTDLARTALAASSPGVDLIVGRGWYSSTDFWSPRLFDRFVYPCIAALAAEAHRYDKPFAYTMTTGVEQLGRRLIDAGVDVLYFADPVQDLASLERVRDLLGGHLALVGGTNALTLASGDPARIHQEVEHAMRVLGPTGRFILHPVDALFPDTPWSGVETLIEAWRAAL